ncbi:PAS domain-containing hybrid sensor histidine kinase/response regulator [Pseudanabaena sp. BC1403]|uniref:PAS domain-containing hybrid sensor histidine kinase/response regulator n=1 Tax=Pseudanabaena sp. BC1403 TaxID=2043171 RepID=UPI000CD90C46|nr:PAS domain-containing hybrid sensor histidine kinase/response regulator [Pseudanabaena sp. BC1403]
MESTPSQLQELRSTLGKMEIALGAVDSAIVWTNAEGRIQWCNKSFDRLVGKLHIMILGKELPTLLPLYYDGVLVPAEKYPVALAIEKKGKFSQSYEFHLGEHGSIIEVVSTYVEIVANEPKEISVVIAINDITEQQRTQSLLLQAKIESEHRVELRTQELVELNKRLNQQNYELQLAKQVAEDSNEELARATRLKDEFLANMSHELRTPLNAILGMSEALQEHVFGAINQEQKDSLETITSSGTHLLELINDILDVAKIESGQVEIDCSQTEINELCQSSLPFVKQQALRKRIHLELKIAPNLPELFVDERRIRQVLINLLSNAIKFTPEKGRVSLAVSLQQNPAKITNEIMSEIRFAVTDTGIGISPENMQKLFQPFVQIDGALNRQNTGTGLGLALVKSIVEMHNGTVSVTSEVGVGSCFTIALPCENISMSSPIFTNQLTNQSTGSLEPSPDNGIAEGLPILLLAEDNDGNKLTISRYLKAKGYQLLFAKDGQEAIDIAKAMRPDLILMDIQMPNIDGLEAIKIIRRDNIPELANIPIIALTALAMTGDRERCIKAGANEYLTKPIKLNQLANTIKQILSPKAIKNRFFVAQRSRTTKKLESQNPNLNNP